MSKDKTKNVRFEYNPDKTNGPFPSVNTAKYVKENHVKALMNNAKEAMLQLELCIKQLPGFERITDITLALNIAHLAYAHDKLEHIGALIEDLYELEIDEKNITRVTFNHLSKFNKPKPNKTREEIIAESIYKTQ